MQKLIDKGFRVGRFQLRSSGKHIQILTSSGKKMFVLADKLYTRYANVDHAGVDDMTKLPYLNEPEVLFNLARRYALNDIYMHHYRAMVNEGRSRSILVEWRKWCFGKTKTTKLLMQYLTYIGGRAASDDRTVEQQVLEVRV
ncbi:hypothetical protein IFM89_031230 [Coptis chinensis]|uniref:Uncharacterized protein n=1 Tax=Coptis chinensis TaxID=261450 RepID=A0A835IUB5_9MAGN|nr:hypothetical protein IFM89_031230 [Coptis chinensis]